MTRPRLYDGCCKAGGATRGYQMAGFHVTGGDVEAQPRYCGDAFVEGDALDFIALHGDDFDAIHVSPPCQEKLVGLGAVNRALGRAYDHVDLVPAFRALLQPWARRTGGLYVIEQPMKGARLHTPAVYCGSSFGLPIHRHRQFESNILLLSPECEHDRLTEAKYWTGFCPNGERTRSKVVQVYGNGGDRHEWGPALDIDWMVPGELTQAIPPAFTEHIGRQLLAAIDARAAA